MPPLSAFAFDAGTDERRVETLEAMQMGRKGEVMEPSGTPDDQTWHRHPEGQASFADDTPTVDPNHDNADPTS